jgi:hypothetical protein
LKLKNILIKKKVFFSNFLFYVFREIANPGKKHVLEFKINLISNFCHQIAKRKEKEALEAELQAAIKEKEAQVRNKTINKL